MDHCLRTCEEFAYKETEFCYGRIRDLRAE